MTVAEAQAFLSGSSKFECRDHSFGDREVYWSKDGKDIADGYFGSSSQHVSIQGQRFVGNDAYLLDKVACRREHGSISRNDETGEDYYRGA